MNKQDDLLFKIKQEKARRQSMFTRTKGSLIPPKSYTKRTICNIHLILAEKIEESTLSVSEKVGILLLVDEAYNLGKRMDTKLTYYNSKTLQT